MNGSDRPPDHVPPDDATEVHWRKVFADAIAEAVAAQADALVEPAPRTLVPGSCWWDSYTAAGITHLMASGRDIEGPESVARHAWAAGLLRRAVEADARDAEVVAAIAEAEGLFRGGSRA